MTASPAEPAGLQLKLAAAVPAADVAALDEAVAVALRASLAPNTWKAYAADWRHWSAWAADHGLPTMPAGSLDLARYLVDQAGLARVGTLTRRCSAIAKAHLLAGHGDPADDPAVREVLRGLRREHGTARRGAPPLWTSDVERIIDTTYTVPDRTLGAGQGSAEVRDRALLLLAFTSALRRSELAALDLAGLELDPAGLIVHVARSKTDQDAEGAYVGIPYASRPRLCAVLAVHAWTDRLAALLDAARGELAGPLFRPVDRRGKLGSLGASRHGTDARLSHEAIRDAVIRRARAAGLSPAHGERFFTAHSTRSGFATQAAANGVSEARSWIRAGGAPCRSPAPTSAVAACSPTTPPAGSGYDRPPRIGADRATGRPVQPPLPGAKRNPGDVAEARDRSGVSTKKNTPVMTDATPRGQRPLARVLEDRLSRERLKPYRAAVGGDLDSAIGLYEWNSAAAAAFFETLGHFEVLLRNALHDQLSAWHTAAGRPGHWYDDPAGVLDARRHADIAAARDRIRRERKTETPGKVVAELNFGFWRFLLDRRYQTVLWAPALRRASPHLQPQRRDLVYSPVYEPNRLRNRIAHHEPIHDRNLSDRHRDLLRVTGFLDPAAQAWLSSRSRTLAVLQSRPR